MPWHSSLVLLVNGFKIVKDLELIIDQRIKLLKDEQSFFAHKVLLHSYLVKLTLILLENCNLLLEMFNLTYYIENFKRKRFQVFKYLHFLPCTLDVVHIVERSYLIEIAVC